MKGKRIGRQTVQFSTPPVIRAAASVVGRKEGEGPLRDRFDSVSQDTYFGEKSWEQAESAMLRQCFARVCSKAALPPEALDYVLSGDLLNQCVGSAYAMRGVGAPYLGLYGACSTMAEAVSLAAMLIDGGCAETAAALTSSHFCSAERQYRFPLEYGGVRPLAGKYNDCGLMIYDLEAQDVHAGGSGCGCSASVLAGHLMKLLTGGQIRRLLFAATGALMSPTASMQGQSIPGICHAVAIETQVNA